MGEPLIGVAAGDDPLFDEYKTLISPDHITPRELWQFAGYQDASVEAPRLRVISVAFPFSEKIKAENARATEFPTEAYSLARNYANALIFKMMQDMVAFLEERGFQGVVGELSEQYNVTIEKRMFSNWSERHVAYAAGLGTFSLHEALITEAGCNVRLGSVVTNAPLPVTPRKYDGPHANCLHYANGTCDKCIARCPAGAITKDGHDKFKCWMHGQKVERHMRKRIGKLLKPHYRRLNGIYSPAQPPVGCALCQFGVPCTGANPARKIDRPP
ncbi:MAG: epoxyqueuosine reductase [Candidatus Lokiarchaeota archaeon]|nr:epoxyqueuosine reductase [Candidatus Lokiarchaeota archaeon]